MSILRFSATIRDEWGREAPTSQQVFVSDTSDLATVDSEFITWFQALDACTDGQIVRADWANDGFTLAGIKTAAVAGSRIEQTGLLGFSAQGSDKRFSFALPALSNVPTVRVGDRIVLTGGDPVALLIALLTTATADLAYCNGHVQTINAFKDALVVTRKHRKQLQRSSFEV